MGSLFSLKLEVRLIEVFRYPTGTKLTGIVFVHDVGWTIGTSLESSTGTMEELCEGSTLKNLVIMVHQWDKVTRQAEELLQLELSSPSGFVQEVVRRGAKIYRCTGASEPDLGALRIILGGGSVALDKGVKELRRELEEQKRRAQEEADVLKKHATEMQRKAQGEADVRQKAQEEADMFKKQAAEMQRKVQGEADMRRKAQEEADILKKQAAEMQRKAQEEADGLRKCIAELQRKAQEEADGLRKCIAELQFMLEEDRHTSGKSSATYHFRHVPAHPI